MNLLHYMLRPYMPLPADVVAAIGLDGAGQNGAARSPYRWQNLTDNERDQLAAMYPPLISVATFNGPDAVFLTAAWTEQDARTRIERAWDADQAECRDCCGELPPYPVTDETNVVTGPVGSVWRDGSFYPKGNN